MNYNLCLFLITVIILSFFQVSASPDVQSIPGLLGFGFSISSGTGLSSGTMISSGSGLDSGLSTGVSISESTSIAPSQSDSAPVTQKGSSGDVIPSHWVIGTREGDYLDPVLNTNWVYDNILKKYYSPANNWFLVNQYSGDGSLFAQFYYDPKLALFIDMATGKTILPGQGGQTGEKPGSAVTTQPTAQPVSKPTPKAAPTSQKTPVPEPSREPAAKPTPKPSTMSATSENPCEITCSECSSGVCDDCNGNGKCDDKESSSSLAGDQQTPTLTPTETPVPEKTLVKETPEEGQTPTETATPEETQIEEQSPTETLTPTETPTQEVTPEGEKGGISEEGQATVTYVEKFESDSGILSVIACDSSGSCDYCLDNNGDGTCTEKDCTIIPADSGDKGDFCVDCDKDGKCDSNKILLIECFKLEDCIEAEYCIDNDTDKQCDRDKENK